MKKLKLQMQLTLDGYAAGPSGEMDWMEWNWTDDIKKYVSELTNSVDTILLGRKMTGGFISHWENVKPDDEQYPFARKMVDYQKIVFTNTLNENIWTNTKLAKGNLVGEVNNLKAKSGEDIIVYGGVSFVSSLIKYNLIDEYHLFINPAAIGKGLEIFQYIENEFKLKLVESTAFDCGIVVNHYKP